MLAHPVALLVDVVSNVQSCLSHQVFYQSAMCAKKTDTSALAFSQRAAKNGAIKICEKVCI